MRRALVPLSLAAVALLWGVAFVAIKQGLREVSPWSLAVLRFAIAALLLAGVMAIWPKTRPRIPRDAWGRIVVLGFTGVPAYHLALNWGEQRTSASVAALIVATAPVMVALASPLALGERVNARGVVGIALAFAGVGILAAQSRDGTATQVAGFAVTILAPAAWAVYTIIAKPLTARIPSIQITIASMLVGTVMLLPLVGPALIRDARALSLPGWGWTLWLGAGGSAAGYILFNYALTHLSATKVAVSIYFVPVIALIAAWAVIDEPLGPRVGVAAVLVLAGVALTQRGGVRARAPLPPAEEPVAIPSES